MQGFPDHQGDVYSSPDLVRMPTFWRGYLAIPSSGLQTSHDLKSVEFISAKKSSYATHLD